MGNNFKSMSKKELAVAYNISSKTLFRRLKAIGIVTRTHIFLPEQLNLIFKNYGNPKG